MAETKRKMTAFLLSFLYTFISEENVEVGFGDLLAEGYIERKNLPGGEMTNMFNDLSGSSLPSSVFSFPIFFSLKQTYKNMINLENARCCQVSSVSRNM